MKDIYDLLKELKARKAKIYTVDNKLKLDIKQEYLTKELSDKIKHFRDDLLTFLSDTKEADYGQIEKVTQQESYPLSDAQRRLWILSQFEEGYTAYNMPGNFYLNSTVDIESFKKALRSVVERHEILRTVFKKDESGETRQWILPSEDPRFDITYIDFRNIENKQDRIYNHLKDDANSPFDLERGPLLRSGLIQIEDEDYIYYSNMHHIISDGWSMEVYFKDLYAYYEAYRKKKRPDIDELRIQYKDYAAWQLNQLQEGKYNADQNFWFNYLDGELPQLNLPSYKARKRIKTYAGEDLDNSIISPLSTGKLKKYTEENGGSLFMGIFAVWNALMYRYTDQQDIIIGTPISGREHVDMKNQIGFYVNTLAIRNKVKSDDNFNTFFASVKKNMINSFSHQMYPFNRLVDELNFERDISRSPIFDIMLVYAEGTAKKEGVDSDKNKLGGIEDYGFSSSRFDLEIGFRNMDNDYISVWGTFNPEVYEREMIDGLIKHFNQIVKVIVANPDVKISELDFLTKAEREQQLVVFNDTAITYPKGLSLAELFEEQALKTPDLTAVTFEGKKLTYRELNELSNQFANCLIQEYGIKNEDLVGVQLDRNEWVIITILGILKTGAAYVPIDPDYPVARKEHIISDTDIKLLITEANFVFDIDYYDGTIFAVDVEFEPSNFNTESLGLTISPNQLAYVIYTSGSTGIPKGVMVEQQAVVRLVKNTNFIDITAGDKILGLSNFSFDGSIFDIFMPLLNGGELVIASKEVLVDLNKLNDTIASHEIDHFFITTVLFNSLVESGASALMNLKCILFGGEQVSVNYVQKFKKSYPGVKLHHVYGPTENTTYSTWYLIDNVEDNALTIPIGKGISNSTVYILDNKNQILPIGVTGEICVGGDGLARGYLNQPELTKAKFIDHPFVEGEKLYKTGDLGRWLPNGFVEFIGRKDDQVKVRGYRIELGEIEHALASNNAIQNAVVLAKEAQTGEKELVAYITADEPQNIAELRAKLKEKLPDYMVPAYFVQLPEMPLTSNGKVNKKLLPNPEGMGITTGVEYVAPRNKVEEKIVTIWQEILLQEKIGVKDDFFDLGGHSLKVIRLSNEYQKEFEVKLSVNDLFAQTTLEAHAQLISTSSKTTYVQIPAITEHSNNHMGYAISDAQRRLWVLSQFGQGSIAYNMPSVIPLNGDYDTDCFKSAIKSTIERHEILRTIFKTDDKGEVKQVILTPEELNFEIGYKDFREEVNKDRLVKSFMDEESVIPFDLEKGPLLRATLLQVENEEYFFFYNMHHIISDGWSMEVLAKDVLAYYQAHIKNIPPKLETLRIQYKDYAAWQLAQIEEEAFSGHKSFWQNQFSGSLAVIDLPSNKKRPRIKTSNGRALSTYLDSETTKGLKKYTQDNGGSLFMGLLAAWNVLVYRYTSQTDIIFGTPSAGREHVDLKDQIGFYVNTLALRNEVKPKETFSEFYERVKVNTLNSYDHQMYPFDRLVEELNLLRDTSRSAIFDVMLILQNVGEKMEGIELSSEEVNRIYDQGMRSSKFDMSITFQEIGNFLEFQITYNPDVYEATMVEGLIKHYKQLVRSILANPEEKIVEINYLSQSEEQQLLEVCNQTEVQYPKQTSIVDLFEEQVAKTPNNIALVFQGKELTYSELNEQSNQLAQYLHQCYDIQPNELVGIKQGRSEWMIISLLAVLKSGGAYVPIDPEFPENRIQYIKKDTNYKVCLDEVELDIFKNNQQNYSPKTIDIYRDPKNLAYVIYTSGSTGNPKGVMVNSESIIDYTYGIWHKTNMSECQHFGHISTMAADLGNTVIFPALLNGRTLHIIAQTDLLNAENLAVAKLDCIKMTPSHWKALRNEERLYMPNKCLILGGEQLSEDVIGSIQSLNDSCEVYNHYGPTETTIGKLIHHIDMVQPSINGSIGKPIGNNQVYILNEARQLCPKGIMGEICISGVGLAEGYLNDQELTNTKFVENPFKAGARLYKTGDLGKWLEDGSVAYVGRIDDQVKVRGYRIELGEIENALTKLDGVKEAVVMIKQNLTNEKEIVAYIVAAKEQNVSEIRGILKQHLPIYMLPAHFVRLDELPLTPNGKVDKKSLPNPDGLGLDRGVEYIPPRNETEQVMVSIWEEVLKRDKIGVKDDFFALGGHSISAIKLMSKIQEKFDVRLNLEELFNDPTILSLAGYIDALTLISQQSATILDEGEELLF